MSLQTRLRSVRNIRKVPTVLQDTVTRIRKARGTGTEEQNTPEVPAEASESIQEKPDISVGHVPAECPAEPEAAPQTPAEAAAPASSVESAPAESPAEPEPVPQTFAEAAGEAPSGTNIGSLPSAKAVFDYFREIAAIPHGSFHTEAISAYLEKFALDRGLDCRRDEMGNLIIRRPAAAGFENAAPVALQGHIDMVCEKELSNPIDMEKEAITVLQEGEWLRADRTTLGGDDGIAVAIMMAVLSDETICCPPVECIFTVDEEVGLLGAAGIDLSNLQSRRLINIDSEEEGIITAGCAGGAEEVCTLTAQRREKKGQALVLTVSGLKGGHSGECIGMGRANADLLLARLLYRLETCGKYSIVSLNGGNRDNAIPRDARAEILFTGKNVSRGKILNAVETFSEEITAEYSMTDPEIRIDAVWGTGEEKGLGKDELRNAFSRKDSRRFVRFLLTLPNGVMEYSPLQDGMPQTSLSLGIVRTMADGMRTHSLVRSNLNSQKQMLQDRFACLGDVFDADIEIHGAYPAWERIGNSAFRDLAVRTWEKISGSKAQVQVIHSGLECGLLAAKVPGLDCISIGPEMEAIHTPAERLNIPSSERVYAYVLEILAECAREKA